MKRRVNGPHWQDNKQRKVQLAADISARVRATGDAAFRRTRPGLTWVTRNRYEIEKRRVALGSIPPRELQARVTGSSSKLLRGADTESRPRLPIISSSPR